MGEVDTDPIKSVRASVFHFGEKCSQIRSRSISDDESEKERGLEVVLQDLANCKVQLEAMDVSHKQALLNQNQLEKTINELSMLLKTSEFEKDIYINECKEAKVRVSELESKIQEMTNELAELESTRADLIVVKKQLMEATDAKLEGMKQAEVMETQVKYIELLEIEVTQMKQELQIRGESELTKLETMKSELEEIGNREREAQVEIALLKAELHKGRSKTAAAEAAELKAKGEKSAAYFALQQMALENKEVKDENQRLQSEHEEIQFQDSYSEHEITISLEEYETLIEKAEEAKVKRPMESENEQEMEHLKKDLENAMARVSEFRTRAEQAATRAAVAEQAKAALEEQIKGLKEQKQRRRAALAALRAESMSKSSRSFDYDVDPKTYMPLGKFLKMSI
uniref:filament-like plant protein 3 n=1 Tax=Erigeron canadensis TaxID=72917 RepID=UPI001CB95D7A|nr:filament-like plant protein 3 [Erigeron canadensis]